MAILHSSGERICGAVAVGPQTLVTAYHCVRKAEPNGIVRYTTQEAWTQTARLSYPARITQIVHSRDLAWLAAEGPPMPVVRLRPPRIREALYAVVPHAGWVRSGFGEAVRYVSLGQTETLFYLDLAEPPDFLETTLSVQRGWSGSPVFGLDGAVVGLVDACAMMWSWVERAPRCAPGQAFVTPFR